jgi:hypothetical protein
MKLLKNLSTGLLCSTLCTGALSADLHDCNNIAYRDKNPDKCENFLKPDDEPSIFIVLSGALIAGSGLALAANINSDAKASTSVPMPTMQTYDTVGYTDPVALSAALSDPRYSRNAEHFNEIRLAYSLARGFTGQGANVAILDTADYNWHGTAVANTVQTAIAQNAKVTPYKVVDDAGKFLSYANIGAVISSADDAKIFNASWGISTTAGRVSAYNIKTRSQMVALTDEKFINSIVKAAVEKDAVFVWSAGNDGTKQSNALTAMPRVVPELKGHFINVVAWDTESGSLAWYSNHCGVTKDYCITAPGSRIDVGTGATASGTSFAAPMVSGAIAVIQEAFPYMTAVEITKLLFATARDLGAAGVDEVYGWGMLDLERATRPVGAAMVPLADEMRPMQTTSVSGVMARKLKSADLNFTFFDSFGRGFTAKLNDNIQFENRGRGFDRLRGDDPETVISAGGLEFGFSNENLLIADGFLETDQGNLTSFAGIASEFSIGEIRFFHNARLGMTVPSASENSFVSGFSAITSASAKFGAQWKDWTGFIAAPSTVISGKMNLHLPAGRDADGVIRFADATLDLAERPALEYSIGYKFLSASFIDNPARDKDEFFIMARGRFAF